MDENQPPKVVVHPPTEPALPAGAPTAAAAASPAAPALAGSTLATVTDARSRTIVVSKLSPLDKMRLFRVAGAEQSSNMQLMGYAVFAAAVRSINGSVEPFPTTMRQIEMMVELLGDEGLEAVTRAYVDSGWVKTGEGDPAAIKN